MKSLVDVDWYEHCQYKFKYVDREVGELKNKEKLDIYDEIKLNTLLNVLKSPMDYANLELAKLFTDKPSPRVIIPFREKNYTDERFKNEIKKQLKIKNNIVDQEMFEIFDELFKDKTYKIFNTMQNIEKHAYINSHHNELKRTTEFSFYNVNNSEIDSFAKGEDSKVVKMSNKSNDSSKFQGNYYKEIYYFYYEEEKVDEVFGFLNKVENMAKKFVEDIKNYIDMPRTLK